MVVKIKKVEASDRLQTEQGTRSSPSSLDRADFGAKIKLAEKICQRYANTLKSLAK